MSDACLSAFGVFFTQSPSFLAYQREMRVRQGRDNAQSLFGVTAIPSDNEIRNLLDPVAPSNVGGLYWETFADLQAQGLLADHHGFEQQRLCALDGMQYFSSEAIHCDPNTVRTLLSPSGKCSISVPKPSIAITVPAGSKGARHTIPIA